MEGDAVQFESADGTITIRKGRTRARHAIPLTHFLPRVGLTVVLQSGRIVMKTGFVQ
jgi:hypothetical protein